MSTYREKLIEVVMHNSRGKTWEEAVREWEIIDCIEDESQSESCICGKDGIKYLYKIHNLLTNVVLFPIGSRCIQKFERKDLNEKIYATEQMFKLLHAVDNDEFLELKQGLFSRKILYALYEEGAFKPNEYNNYDGRNSYEFMLKMYNQRKAITPKQQSKINAVLINDIKPFLKDKLAGKIK